MSGPGTSSGSSSGGNQGNNPHFLKQIDFDKIWGDLKQGIEQVCRPIFKRNQIKFAYRKVLAYFC